MSAFGSAANTTGFGAANTTGFGAQNTTGFGAANTTGFGAQNTTGFGAQNTGFGAQNTTGFGAQNTTGFGAANTTGFGAANTTGFGGQNTTGFGAQNTGFGAQSTGFGAQNTGFGAQSTGFGAQSTGFGAQNTTGFGGQNTTGFGTQNTGFGAQNTGFGAQSTTGFGAPITGFGAAKPGFSFSQPSSSFGNTSLFGQQPQMQPMQLFQPQQQQPQIDERQAFQQSIFQCHKFGDERDSTLASLNYLQACWGSGKGLYSQTFPPVNYNQSNPFYRFKAVGYAFMYTDINEDGQVVVHFNKPQVKMQAEETNIVASLQNMLGRPNILIRFTGTKAISEEATMAILFAEDRNTLRRIPATDMAAALCQPQLKPQLEGLGVVSVNAKVKPSPEQLKRYLENPPDGIDPRIWQQAQEDNPDNTSMIPIPLVGVEALKSRIEWQEKETQQHHARLKLLGDDVTTLLNRHANTSAELQQMRRKHVTLTHRLISVVCRQELMRKQGTTLQPDEEMLKKKIEEMDSELNSPTQYKGRLNELLSQIRLHKSTCESRPVAKFTVDTSTLGPVKEFLAIQQESIKHLVATTKADADTVKDMIENLAKINSKVPH